MIWEAAMFELDEIQSAIEGAVRGWCEKELGPNLPALESGEMLPYDLLRQFGRDLGISEPLVAAAEKRISTLQGGGSKERKSKADGGGGGGLGDDPMIQSVLLKEICRVSPGFGMVFISTLGCEKIGAWALTEPGAGSDAFGGMRTTATPEGNELVVKGQKTLISNAPYADVFVVYARVVLGEEKRLVRGIVLERGTPGLETGPPMHKMGMHDSPTGEIFLEGCRVPMENLIGSLETGERGRETARAEAGFDILNRERSVMPAMCLGIIERCVEESIRYAKTREQFGRPIAEFQAIGFKLARMELALENARNLVFKLAWAEREGKLDARLASLAKLYCAEQATQVALDAIQIHGGAGYIAELPIEKLMRDAKMFEIGGGTNEMQLQTIARSILA
jgi:alkylation response protein AidB-like acyl-CoA dehydrogenase